MKEEKSFELKTRDNKQQSFGVRKKKFHFSFLRCEFMYPNPEVVQ